MKNISPSGKVNRILFAVDGAPESTGAVDAVATVAKASNAVVHVLHVWNLEIRIDQKRWDVETLTEARRLVEGIAGRLNAAGVSATSEVLRASEKEIPEAIAAAACRYSADLVAVGSRGRSDLRGLFLGSVSHRVLHKLSCPVLIVRQGTGMHRGARLERVLLAVAGGDEVPRAIEAVVTIAAAAHAMVRVLHVRPLAAAENVTWIESEAEGTQVVDAILAELRVAGVTAESKVAGPSSFVARDIAEAANTWDADLIVMGSRRLSELGGLVAGNINHDVIHLTDRPVLVAERS
jgi:nucleotide-binding universal stress UspA family protein